MANEFKIKNGLIVDQGGAQITGSVNITGSAQITGSVSITYLTASNAVITSITGSLFGTASFAQTASISTTSVTSSYPIAVSSSTIYSTVPSAISSGKNNAILLGPGAGSGVTSIYNSNFIGYGAGNTATNAYQSNFIGVYAGNEAAKADDSNFIGMFTGYRAASASFSNLIGWQVGYTSDAATSIGSNNIIIGTNITLASQQKDSINLGGIIFATGSYSSIAGNPFSGSQYNIGKVGINIVTPKYTLDVSGSGNFSNGLTVTGSLNATSFTGSLFGSASWAVSASWAPTQNIDTSSLVTTASFNAFTSSYNTGSFTGSFTGTLIGTSSWANNALTASFITASNVYGPFGANSVVTASYATTSSFSLASSANTILVINKSGNTISKGMVVHLTGSNNSSDTPYIITASYDNDRLSANTLGIATQTIAFNSTGYITTEGVLTGLDVTGLVSGQMVYLGATGSITGSAPLAPLHAVRLGQVVRDSPTNNGSIYVRIDNGYELGELHDVLDTTTTSSYGDLLVRSGSVWINSKQLTGSYELTGSLNATSFTGSLFGTASFAANGGVTQIIAGTNVTISPSNGLGQVTINATTGGGSGAGANVTSSFTNSSTWTFTHALANRGVVVQTYDTSWNQIIPQSITLTDANTATITFPSAQSGYAIATLGGTVSTAASASYVNTLNQNVIITGSLAIGTGSIGSGENNLLLGPAPAGGTGEGGQLALLAVGGTYTSSSFLDNYQNQFRILSGLGATSNAGVLAIDLSTKNATFQGAVTASGFSGLPNDYLYVTRNTSQTIGSGTWADRDVIFNNSVVSKGITYNTSTGLASLTGGKVYRITARIAWSAAATYLFEFSCYNSSNTQLGPSTQMVQSTNGSFNISDGTLDFIYAPGSNVDIKIRTTSNTTALSGESIRGDLNTQLIIQQIA